MIRTTASCRVICFVAIFVALLSLPCLVGCGLGGESRLSGLAATPGDTITGRARGGENPINGATVQMYAVDSLSTSSAGYGVAAHPLVNCSGTPDANGFYTNAQCTGVQTANGGAFSISPGNVKDYACPTGAYVYLVATGGDSGGGTNTAAALMAGLGLCSTLTTSSYIDIDEISTVSTVYALQQFMSGNNGTRYGASVGTPSTNIKGLSNAFASIPLMETLATGVAQQYTENGVPSTVDGTALTAAQNPVSVNGTNVYLHVINDQLKINTIADILAYCISSGDDQTTSTHYSAQCNTLFSDVTPSGGTAPQDTIQAALMMARNPVNDVSALYALAASQSPFMPTLSASPTDWNVELLLGCSQNTTVGGSSASFLGSVYRAAADSLGDIVVLNSNSVSTIAPGGLPVSQILNNVISAVSPRGIAIDTSNNIYVVNSTATSSTSAGPLVKYANGTVYNYTGANASSIGYIGIALDKVGDAFISSGSGDLILEVPAGAATGTEVASTGLTTNSVNDLAFDANQDLWWPNSAGTSNTEEALCQASTTVASGCTYSNTATTGTLIYKSTTGNAVQANPYGVVIDAAGNSFTSNYNSSDLGYIVKETAGTTTAGTGTTPGAGGASYSEFLAIDGLGNVWVANNSVLAANGTIGAQTGDTVSEFSNTQVPLSGTNGFTNVNLPAPRGVVIDLSGNVWVYSYKPSGTTRVSLTTTTGGVTTVNPYPLGMIVGAAAPVVTPIQKALINGSLGVRP